MLVPMRKQCFNVCIFCFIYTTFVIRNQTLHSFKLLFDWRSSILWSRLYGDTLQYIKQKPTVNLSKLLNCSWKQFANETISWIQKDSDCRVCLSLKWMIVFLFSFSSTDAYVPNKRLLSRCPCSQSNLFIALLTFIVRFFFSSLLCCDCWNCTLFTT